MTAAFIVGLLGKRKDVMKEFCKVFSSEKDGQILVKIDRHQGTECPEVRFYAQPEYLGVCSVAACYEDDDNGWDKAEAYFASMTLEKAELAIRVLVKAAEDAS